MKTFKKVLLSLLALILLALGAAVFIAYSYGDKVKAYILGELNKQLNTEVSYQDLSFSVIRNFPNASVTFDGVLARDAFPDKRQNKDTLFYAGHISLAFSLMDIFHGNYTVKSLLVNEGKLCVKTDAKGQDNYHFWKSSSQPDKSSFSFRLNKVELSKIDIVYRNLLSRQNMDLLANEILLRGDFSKTSYSLKADSKLFVKYLRSDSSVFLKEKPVILALDIDVSNNSTYILHTGKVSIADMELSTSGRIRSESTQWTSDLSFSTSGIDIGSLLSVLPENSLKAYSGYKFGGRFNCSGTVKGKISSQSFPSVYISFALSDAHVKIPSSDLSAENIGLKGAYSNGESHNLSSSSLQLNEIKATIGEEIIRATLGISNFKSPSLRLRSSGSIDLASLNGLPGKNTIEDLSGKTTYDLSYNGPLDSLSAGDISGNAVLNNAAFLLKSRGLKVQGLNGSINLNSKELTLTNLSGKLDESDFLLNGKLANVLEPSKERIRFDLSIHSNSLKLDKLLAEPVKKDDQAPDSTAILAPRGTIQLTISELSYRKFAASSVRSTLQVSDSSLALSNSSLQTMSGRVSFSANVSRSVGDSLLISCNSSVKSINMHTLFTEFENFGQNTLTDDNINGTFTGDILFYALCSKDLTIDDKKIYVKSDVTLENGELIDFAPMMALSRFIKVSELKNIKFSTLRNQIEIRNRQIFIPSMEIKSNALNLTAAGIHTFDNTADYKLNLSLNSIFGKKVKEQSTEFGEIEDDSLGRFYLPLLMKGDIHNPKFYYDKSAVASKIKTDLKKEKETLKQVLKEEFSWLKKKPLAATAPAEVKKTDEPEIDWEKQPVKETGAEKPKKKKSLLDRLKDDE